MGRRPEAEDTLGWILLKKGSPRRHWRRSSARGDRAPERAIYSYHVGLAHIELGDSARAREALTNAVSWIRISAVRRTRGSVSPQ